MKSFKLPWLLFNLQVDHTQIIVSDLRFLILFYWRIYLERPVGVDSTPPYFSYL